MKTSPVPVLCLALGLGVLAACSGGPGPGAVPPPDPNEYRTAMEAIAPLHEKKKPPRPGDWLQAHEEPGQTFAEYVDSDPVRPDAQRNKLYIVLLGPFTEKRRTIVKLAAEFMGLYFSLPVKFMEPLDLSVVTDSARRKHWGLQQLHAGYILDEVLKPRVPEDAVALIAFTARDLWPREGWNFVFGMASLRRRVGVWSLCRFGNPADHSGAFRLCLLRTIKTGTHETGHMLGMYHCTAYECNMNGSNNLPESDRGPLALCPECAAKIWWACKVDPVDRYRRLEAFCRKHGLVKEAEFYASSWTAIASAQGLAKRTG